MSRSTSGETFAFTPDSLARAKAEIAKYPAGRQQSAVMALLDIAQRQEGWVSQAVVETVAAMLEMAPMRVQEVASFYTMYNLRPVGRHHIQVCSNISCMLRGSEGVLAALRDRLGIDIGETTADGAFTLAEVECLGACVNAPTMQIGDDYYEDLTPESAVAVLDALERGEVPAPGSQSGRQFSAPEGGPTTLTGIGTPAEASDKGEA
jgi:NADH-quinone oxidoreductase subunit E/NADH dehydrogenase (ubiquinone) flavoprotein 2